MDSIYCLGDSFTEGTMSYNWINRLRFTLPLHYISNEGVNGDTVCMLAHRLNTTIELNNPNYVIIMIGGNDVIGSSKESYGDFYMKQNPTIQTERPSLENYKKELTNIIEKMDKELPAHTYILVLSPPPIGEGGMDSIEWKTGESFNEVCRELAEKSSDRVIYKDLFNAVLNDMDKKLNGKYTDFSLDLYTMLASYMCSCVLSYENIRWINGYSYTTDGVHFCEDFGNVCERLIYETISDIENENIVITV